MNATIEGEIDEGIGVRVVDNNGVEHRLTVDSTGSIVFHSQDRYPDEPDARTNEEQELVFQSRHYAKYYVGKETEYDTVPWDLNPDRFEIVRQTLRGLSVDECETYFDELLRQSLSHYRDEPSLSVGDVSRPVALPAEMIGDEDAVMYQQEIYLDEDDELEAVSGIEVCYYVAEGDRRTARHGTAPDRDPDARVEISPAPITAPEPFRDYLIYNLRCQIRDCYVGMGLEPPSEYRVLGQGQYRFTVKYLHFDMYPEYFDKDADVPGYSYEFAPDLPTDPSDLVRFLGGPRDDASLYDRIRDTFLGR